MAFGQLKIGSLSGKKDYTIPDSSGPNVGDSLGNLASALSKLPKKEEVAPDLTPQEKDVAVGDVDPKYGLPTGKNLFVPGMTQSYFTPRGAE